MKITLTEQFGLYAIERFTKYKKAETLLVTEDSEQAQREYDRLTGRTEQPMMATA